jgi:hypothetical protein
MNDFEKIEHLLLSKKFEELSPTEVKEVADYFENSMDYNDMRDTLMQVKSTLATDKILIKPNVELKEKLLQQFENTYSKQTNTTGKTKPFYKNIVVQWSAAASVILILSLSIFSYIHDMKGKTSDGMAVNYTAHPNEEKPATVNTMEVATDSVVANVPASIEEQKSYEKSKITTLEPIGNNRRNEDESEKPIMYGNYYTTETEVGEGSLERNDEKNRPNDVGFFSSDRNGNGYDNTTLGLTNTTLDVKKEESKDDANYQFNGKINTDLDKGNDQLKGNEGKNMELNTTIPMNQNIGTNTTVDYNKQVTTKSRDYWSKKKNNKSKVSNKDQDQKTLGGMTQAEQKTDSTKVSMDTLKIDSNKNLLENKGDMQMQDNKKDE